MKRLALLTLLVPALVACGSTPPPLTLPAAPPARDAAALAAAVDAYYTAKTPAAMRQAVEAARAAGADAALHHEIAADLATFEDRRADTFEHLVAALLDPGADAAVLYLHALAALDWTLPERTRAVSVLAAIRRDHPDPEARAYAAWMSAHALHYVNDFEGRDAALAELGPRLPFAVIGPFDNDQGQGFDAEQPPERELDLGKRYPGRLVEVGWRTDYPLDPRGKVDLGDLLHPNDWQVAYAASAFRAQTAGTYELRVGTSDPIKVWVNDTLVFQGRRLGEWLFDGMVIPVELRAGVNRVLVKSAQETGSWLLVARVTGPGGAPLAAGAITPVAADTPLGVDPPAAAEPISDEAMIAARVADLPAGPRREMHATLWADDMGLRAPAVAHAEGYVRAYPESLPGRYRLAMELWDNGERGRTADLLNALTAQAGDTLLLVKLKQARFWRQQNLVQKARTLLVEVGEAHPDRPGARRALADLLENEKWHEERCTVLTDLDRRIPDWPAVLLELADCRQDQRFYPRAQAIYERLHAAMPAAYSPLSNLHWLAQGNDDYVAGTRYARALTRAYPHDRDPWRRLAEVRRRAGDREGAQAALRTLVELAPTAPEGYDRLAQIAMQAGETEHAVSLWKEALARDPENDSIANRIAWLAPAQEGAWIAEAPDEAALDAAVAAEVTPVPGTDVVYLLDDEVTRLGADGSAQGVVTMVARAVNQAGRDRLTRMKIRSGGRHRLLHAYAVDAKGRRVEASSIRGRDVRFRQLDIGSTVVLQYRLDERPDGYLAGHIARTWWFQSPGVHTRQARWLLYAPAGVPLLEETVGAVERSERVVGEQRRVEWSAANTPPVLPEPAMPTLAEVAAHVAVSTVPNWDMYWEWEQALLMDVFRESPDLEALVDELLKGAEEPLEKVRRIHAYLIENIRYQQDYERTIAGVKPHAAPVVVARQYGDCKDKAVLFITLARMAGVEVHYALVRTRDAGPVRREVPMQQFNHAIVYVPAQPGIDEGRFYDPTVDALDVDVLRHDDQGTWSLVYDPIGQTHTWREIPLQDPGVDTTLAALDGALDATGAVAAEIQLIAHGRVGAVLRQAARNPETFAQLLTRQIVARAFPGGRLVDQQPVQVDSIREPARVRLALEAQSVGRREGDELRLPLPIGWTPEGYFTLSERRHPVLLGAPRTLEWTVDLALPDGARVKRIPQTGAVESPCISLERTVHAGKDRLAATQKVQFRCERIPTEQYAAHRAVAAEMQELLEQEVVLDVRRAGRQAQR